jgi:hypothetical protein
MTNKILDLIKAKYPLSPIDAGDMATLKASGMKFSVEAYKADGLGHVSVMRAKGFFGLMKMDTLIINPTAIDLPLYSYDRILAMGNDTLIVELYDTIVGEYSDDALIGVKEKFASLPERDPGEHWYDSIKLPSSISKKGKKISAELDKMTLEHFEAYLASSSAPVESGESKKDMAAVYVNGLLEKGGPSTDVFKKELGVEKTTKLFREILFGIA